jgi:hypothetical protein
MVCTKICEVIYTNNPKINYVFILNIYIQYYLQKILVDILLNIFMPKKHPDYRSAKQNLNTIFALIKY